ncbi:hypothetical protein [Rhizobium leguminosarum]|uniref:hypothetical protein n=1 Tax=Rhizobium leguminosarum TaxID=384 RepID=UPI0032AF2D80
MPTKINRRRDGPQASGCRCPSSTGMNWMTPSPLSLEDCLHMRRRNAMAERRDFDASEFADHLTAMTDDELFRLMQDLEKESDDVAIEARETSDAFAKIVLVETAIEDRFPGQLLAPYKEWQQRRTAV